MITSSLETTLLNFASYAYLNNREGYAEVIRRTLLMPEPERSEQLEILKHSIPEILDLKNTQNELSQFVHKYNISVDDIKEFIIYLGPDYYDLINYDDRSFITLPTYLKYILDERVFDKLILLIKLKYGKRNWEEIQYKEMSETNFNNLLININRDMPIISGYIYNRYKDKIEKEEKII